MKCPECSKNTAIYYSAEIHCSSCEFSSNDELDNWPFKKEQPAPQPKQSTRVVVFSYSFMEGINQELKELGDEGYRGVSTVALPGSSNIAVTLIKDA